MAKIILNSKREDVRTYNFDAIKINSKTKSTLKFLANGREGDQTDKARELISRASNLILNNAEGTVENTKGKALINAALTVTVPSKVEADLTPILSVFAEVHRLGVNGVAKISRWELDKNGGAEKGAKGAATRYQRKFKDNVPVAQESFGTSIAMDYRDLMDDPEGEYGSLLGEASKDVVNQVVLLAQDSLVDGLSAAYTASVIGAIFLESAAISQTNVDLAIQEVRTGGGKITIAGDYRAIKQVTAFTGINNENSERTLMFSEENGYVGYYNGAELGALNNFYDYSKSEALASGKVWAKQLNKANLYVINAGKDKHPNHLFLYGPTTTLTGRDVASATEIVRVDQLAGAYFVKERTSHVAIVSDTDLQ